MTELEKHLAAAISWRYGAVADTRGEVIVAWRSQDPQPTDLAGLVSDYLAAKNAVAYIPERKEALIEATRAAKSYPKADAVDGVGFWIDALMGWAEQEITAGRLQSTPEMDALFQIRANVKQTYPKPV